MGTLSISLPESVQRRAEDLAMADGVSVNQYVTMVLSQRIAVAEADSYVRRRGARGSAERLLEILDAAPDVPPAAEDAKAAQ